MLSLLRRIEADLMVLAKRMITALALGGAIAGSVFAAPVWAPVLLLGILVLAATWEWSGLARGAGGGPPGSTLRAAAIVAMAAVMAGAWWMSASSAGRVGIWVLAILWWTGAAVWLAAASRAGALAAAGRMPIAVVAAAAVLSLVPAWLALGRVHVMAPTPWPLVLVLGLVVAADVGAYLVGRLLGRRRLAPHVSPGKTWEGLAGGVASALLLAGAASVAGLPLPSGLIPASLAIAVASVLGDLTVSLFKRSAGVKHSGTLLPGHGGVLDRLDSFCSAGPVFAAWMGLTVDWL